MQQVRKPVPPPTKIIPNKKKDNTPDWKTELTKDGRKAMVMVEVAEGDHWHYVAIRLELTPDCRLIVS